MFPLWEQALYTLYVGKGTGNGTNSSLTGSGGARGVSNSLWSLALSTEMGPSGLAGAYGFFDDFTMFGGAPAGTAITSPIPSDSGSWECLTTATYASIAASTSDVGGVITASANNAANTGEAYMVAGGGALPALINDGGDGKRLIFECRVRMPNSAAKLAAAYGFYGLTDAGAVTGALTAATTPVPKAASNFLGFYQAGATLYFGWQRANGQAFGNAATTQTASTCTVLETAASTAWTQTLTASTSTVPSWYKLGFVYDPTSAPSQRIRVFVDGQDVGYQVPSACLGSWSGTSYVQTSYGLSFPLVTTYLAPALLMRNANSGEAATTVDYDWAGFHQAG